MTVRPGGGPPQALPVEQAAVAVRFTADAAETTLDLTFRNDGDRMLEGEFVLPLPAGATVSDYALEVNGQLREAVAVDKEQARVAYESIKRQMVDPGLVEREAGNAYRTRVFPIPARGTKRLRIGYVEFLGRAGEGLLYQLPFAFTTPLAQFSCTLLAAPQSTPRVLDAAGLDFATAPGAALTATCRNQKIEGTLRVALPAQDGPRMALSGEETPAYYLSDVFPAIAAEPRPLPQSVLLFWDASESRAGIDHGKEFALLDAWFRAIGNTRVSLRLLRDTTEAAGDFEVRGGDWQKLRAALEAVCYDGATSFAGLSNMNTDTGLVLCFTDGKPSLGRETGLVTRPLVVVNAAGTPLAANLARLVARTGGASIDLTRDDPATALAKLRFEPFRVTEVSGDLDDERILDHRCAPGQPVRIHGRFAAGRTPKLVLRYSAGGKTSITREVTPAGERDRSPLAGRLWAQARLLALESAEEPDVQGIVRHCKAHRLVSDHTSLIVLERMVDHVRYRIPPPEPELQQEYEQALARQVPVDRKPEWSLDDEWRNRLRWHAREFPWADVALIPRLQQVSVWQRAVEQVFAPGDYDADSFRRIAEWQAQARAVIERRAKLGNDEDAATWDRDLQQIIAAGNSLDEPPPRMPAAGKPWAVSVRGLVARPGTIRGQPGLTLRGAIAQAGGLHELGSLDNVELFRCTGKTVYNTLSSHYRDVPLLPGDMIVVRQEYFDYASAGMDPFAAGPSTSGSPMDEPAIRNPTRTAPEPFGPGEPPPAPPPVPGPVGGEAIGPPDFEAGESPDLEPLRRQLAAGADPRQAYESFTGPRRLSAQTILATARLLAEHRQPGLAARALGTLVERCGGTAAALCAHAMWLAEFQQTDSALQVLDRCATPVASHGLPREPLRASIHGQAGHAPQAAATWRSIVTGRGPHDQSAVWLQAIALTEFNAFLHRQEAGPDAVPHPLGAGFQQNLDADLRIVAISNTPGYVPISIEEPANHLARGARYVSPCGGHFQNTSGVAEYLIRRAMPGCYRIRLHGPRGTTVRLTLFTQWGRPAQQSTTSTIFLDTGAPAVIEHVHRLGPKQP